MCYIALYSVRKTGNGQTLPTTEVSVHNCTSQVTTEVVVFIQQSNISNYPSNSANKDYKLLF